MARRGLRPSSEDGDDDAADALPESPASEAEDPAGDAHDPSPRFAAHGRWASAGADEDLVYAGSPPARGAGHARSVSQSGGLQAMVRSQGVRAGKGATLPPRGGGALPAPPTRAKPKGFPGIFQKSGSGKEADGLSKDECESDSDQGVRAVKPTLPPRGGGSLQAVPARAKAKGFSGIFQKGGGSGEMDSVLEDKSGSDSDQGVRAVKPTLPPKGGGPLQGAPARPRPKGFSGIFQMSGSGKEMDALSCDDAESDSNERGEGGARKVDGGARGAARPGAKVGGRTRRTRPGAGTKGEAKTGDGSSEEEGSVKPQRGATWRRGEEAAEDRGDEGSTRGARAMAARTQAEARGFSGLFGKMTSKDLADVEEASPDAGAKNGRGSGGAGAWMGGRSQGARSVLGRKVATKKGPRPAEAAEGEAGGEGAQSPALASSPSHSKNSRSPEARARPQNELVAAGAEDVEVQESCADLQAEVARLRMRNEDLVLFCEEQQEEAVRLRKELSAAVRAAAELQQCQQALEAERKRSQALQGQLQKAQGAQQNLQWRMVELTEDAEAARRGEGGRHEAEAKMQREMARLRDELAAAAVRTAASDRAAAQALRERGEMKDRVDLLTIQLFGAREQLALLLDEGLSMEPHPRGGHLSAKAMKAALGLL